MEDLFTINSFEPFKSPGPDGIAPIELQKTSHHVISWLRVIFTGFLKMSHIPKLWRDTKVEFVPKAGKDSHTKPKDFRPISLTSFLLKTLE